MAKVFAIVGIGPGESAYRLPCADKAVEEADFLMGGERHLALFRFLGKENISLAGKIASLPRLIREKREKGRVVLLVSGDPGYHSLLGLISRNFTPDEYRVIPGISSFQLAAARTGLPWQDDLFLSLHGRNEPKNWLERTGKALQEGRRVFFLTDGLHTPRWIGEKVAPYPRCASCGTSLHYRLGHEDESYEEISLKELTSREKKYDNEETLCVMIINPA